MKIKPPDYNAQSTTMGGYLKDIPLPHVLLYGPHSPLRRPVTMNITTWVGSAAIGAKHVYVRFNVWDNYFWDSKQGVWVRPWDCELHTFKEIPDSDRSLRLSFLAKNRDTRITRWVRTMLAKFPAEIFVVRVGSEEVTPTWVFDEEKHLG